MFSLAWRTAVFSLAWRTMVGLTCQLCGSSGHWGDYTSPTYCSLTLLTMSCALLEKYVDCTLLESDCTYLILGLLESFSLKIYPGPGVFFLLPLCWSHSPTPSKMNYHYTTCPLHITVLEKSSAASSGGLLQKSC